MILYFLGVVYTALVWFLVRRGQERPAAGFVLAPLAPCLINAVVSGDVIWGVLIAPYAYLYALTGVPIYFLFRRLGWLTWWQVAAASTILGFAIAGLNDTDLEQFSAYGAAAGLTYGAAAGLTFWLIAFAGLRSSSRFNQDAQEAPRPLSPSSGDPATEPWLRNAQWRKREVVSGRLVGGPFIVLACIFFGAPLVLLAFAEQTPARFSTAVIVLMMIGGLIYLWLRHQRYGNSVCRLLTLPGVIGGKFEADVDCALPENDEEPVVVRLKNLVPAGKTVKEVWRMEEKLHLPVASGSRSVVPVRLRIPRHPAQVPLPLEYSAWKQFLGVPIWMLEIEKKTGGVDFLASFHVPVYNISSAPASKQGTDPNP